MLSPLYFEADTRLAVKRRVTKTYHPFGNKLVQNIIPNGSSVLCRRSFKNCARLGRLPWRQGSEALRPRQGVHIQNLPITPFS